MGGFHRTRVRRTWLLMDPYDFNSTFVPRNTATQRVLHEVRRLSTLYKRTCSTQSHTKIAPSSPDHCWEESNRSTFISRPSALQKHSNQTSQCCRKRYFHDYFVTHLPSSSLHPDSRTSSGPHHKLPRSASTPHTPGSGATPAAAPPMRGPSRDLTVVRIPLRSAKHHFGVSFSRGTRPYNEDTYQAGTIEIPAFAKKAPVSLSRSPGTNKSKDATEEATSAGSASGDPQVFYFGVFDGHGGNECSDFLREELHEYIESASAEFELVSSLQKSLRKEEKPKKEVEESNLESNIQSNHKDSLVAVPIKIQNGFKPDMQVPRYGKDGKVDTISSASALKGSKPVQQANNKLKALELESSLVRQWKETVGGYFRRFKPQYFSISTISKSQETEESRTTKDDGASQPPISIETVLMYAFLRADLDFVTAQASKPDPESTSDLPLNHDEILGEPSRQHHKGRIGGPTRFKGGSTASVAMISTPTPTPFWNPASPSTLLVAHVGDTRILLCDTSTGLALPTTTNHHPSSPVEGTRLRRYAATFVTDSFGEERMSGLANTRAFGDMRSKRIGVSAEPEIRRYELGPAQYSFLALVSDGVSGTLSDQEIVDVVKEAKTPEQGAKDVVAFATEVSKEGDNATCLVIRLGGWERRSEGGVGSLGTKEVRDYRRQDATDPRSRRT